MCLWVDEEKTRKHSKETKNKTYVFYKTFIIHINKLFTPYQCVEIKGPGIIEAEGEINLIKWNDSFFKCSNVEPMIDSGVCHGYTNKISQYNPKTRKWKTKAIKIYVKSNDIVAFGLDDEVCFFKYEIKKKDFKKALQG